MKVLLINVGYAGGGSERYVRELLAHLPISGVEPSLWVAKGPADLPAGIHRLCLPGEGLLSWLEAVPFWSDWRHIGSRRKLDGLSPADFDLIHLNVIHSGCASIKAIKHLCERFPVVWTQHDEWAATGGNACYLGDKIEPKRVKELTTGLMRYIPYHPYHENPRYRMLRRFLDRWMPQPRTICSPSRHMLELVKRGGRFPRNRLCHLPNGLALLDCPEATMPREEARQAMGIPLDCKVILMIANNLRDVHKGMLAGVEAINNLPADLNARVLLLGRHSEEIAGRIRRFPVVCKYAENDPTLAQTYRCADVTVIPSLADNFPYVALESLACQTPVAAFRIGGPAEIIGDNLHGLLADPFNVSQLRDHVVRLLNDQQLAQRLGGQGRAWVREHCGMQRHVEALVSIYRETIGASGPLPAAV